jgi:hypothetical protein
MFWLESMPISMFLGMLSNHTRQLFTSCRWYIWRMYFSFVSMCFKVLFQQWIQLRNKFEDSQIVSVCRGLQNVTISMEGWFSFSPEFNKGHYLQVIVPVVNLTLVFLSHMTIAVIGHWTTGYRCCVLFQWTSVFSSAAMQRSQVLWMEHSVAKKTIAKTLPVASENRSQWRNVFTPLAGLLTNKLTERYSILSTQFRVKIWHLPESLFRK